MYQPYPGYQKRNMNTKYYHSRYKSSYGQYPYSYGNQGSFPQSSYKTSYHQKDFSKDFSTLTKVDQGGNYTNFQQQNPTVSLKKEVEYQKENFEFNPEFNPSTTQKDILKYHKNSSELSACTSSGSLLSMNTATSLSSLKDISERPSTSSISSFSILPQDSFYQENLEEDLYQGKKPARCYFNKFNNPTENSNNENTVILTLKIKVGPNDFRVFNLKKFDDLFGALQKFISLNEIKQELIKPIVSKVFAALNQIFWLMNNKIGIYDKKYLDSLYKVWIKNKGKFPKQNHKKNNSIEVTKEKKDALQPYKSFTDGVTKTTTGKPKEKKEMNNSF